MCVCVCVTLCPGLTLSDEEVSQGQHNGVSTVQEVPTHEVGAGQRQTWRDKTFTTITIHIRSAPLYILVGIKLVPQVVSSEGLTPQSGTEGPYTNSIEYNQVNGLILSYY